MSFDPATVAAFVDGELDDLTARRIEREATSDPALAAEIARQRRLKAQLQAHYAPVIDEAVPERLRALLAPSDKVDNSLAGRREAKRMRFAPIHWGAIAASLALGLYPAYATTDVSFTVFSLFCGVSLSVTRMTVIGLSPMNAIRNASPLSVSTRMSRVRIRSTTSSMIPV